MKKKYPSNFLHDTVTCTAWKVTKYGVISGPYFPAFGLNTSYLSVSSPNVGRYGPEITPYLDTFQAVTTLRRKLSKKQKLLQESMFKSSFQVQTRYLKRPILDPYMTNGKQERYKVFGQTSCYFHFECAYSTFKSFPKMTHTECWNRRFTSTGHWGWYFSGNSLMLKSFKTLTDLNFLNMHFSA